MKDLDQIALDATNKIFTDACHGAQTKARIQLAVLEGIREALAEANADRDGYKGAFYEMTAALDIPAMAASPATAFRTVILPKLQQTIAYAKNGNAFARTTAGQQWWHWADVLRRLIDGRTEKFHFAADVTADETGVWLDNCRFVYAKPCGFVYMGQYVESCDAGPMHAGWKAVWTSPRSGGDQ